MAIKIRPYKMNSKSAGLLAAALSEELGYKVLRTTNPAFMKRHTIINWGSSVEFDAKRLINPPSMVEIASDKLATFCMLQMEEFKDMPEWHVKKERALKWINEGHTVYCRTLLNSKEGRGIVIATKPEEVVDAPLYTKRFVNGREYRVHVAFGEAIQVVQKKKRVGADVNPQIRSNNGWVFARNLDHPVPACVVNAAIKAVNLLGLDFGAVDVVYSVKNDKACVLEVNTAPGIDQTSATIYAKAFAKRLGK